MSKLVSSHGAEEEDASIPPPDFFSSSSSTKNDEELENFLRRADQVSKIINQLTSSDPAVYEKGLMKADLLLGTERNEGKGKKLNLDAILFDPDSACKVAQDRSIINKATKDIRQCGEIQGEEDTQAWMRMMEKDVEERQKRRQEAKERSDEWKNKGNAYFAKGDYPAALKCFNDAIAILKDSPCLYKNRALTNLRLGIYAEVVKDCELALHLDENSLKARMFMAKAYYLMGQEDKAKEILNEARDKLKDNVDEINEYERNLYKSEEKKEQK